MSEEQITYQAGGPKKEPDPPKATVGRIVHYFPGGERKLAGGNEMAAAIVVGVNGGKAGYNLNLQMFSPLGPHYNGFEKHVPHKSLLEKFPRHYGGAKWELSNGTTFEGSKQQAEEAEQSIKDRPYWDWPERV